MRHGVAALLALLGADASAQRAGSPPAPSLAATSAAARLAILAAEDRRASTPRDLMIIRSGARSADGQIARIGIRALGRLERPDLLADILPGLKNPWPEVRAEAANASAQAAQGWAHQPPAQSPYSGIEPAAALIARLRVEADANVRSAIAAALGRLPYRSADETGPAERALLHLLARTPSAADRVGVASGLEALTRTQRALSVSSSGAVESLRRLAIPWSLPSRGDIELASRPSGTAAPADPARDVRVRRLALEALITAGAVDDEIARQTRGDPDPQVRRLAMRAVSTAQGIAAPLAIDLLRPGLSDASAIVRLEALRAMRARGDGCAAAVNAVHDPDPHVALVALDQLAGCPSPDAIAEIDKIVGGWAEPAPPRAWHRPAHALVALATAEPAKAAAQLPRFTASAIWQLRAYAARAAAVLEDRLALEQLVNDVDDNVREAAIDGLVSVAGHSADAIYVDALGRGGYQVLRAAARALSGTSAASAADALGTALRRLVAEGHDNSLDARTAIAETLRGLGVSSDSATSRAPAPTGRPKADPTSTVRLKADTTSTVRLKADATYSREVSADSAMTAADLRRLASARVRVTIRDVGRFDLALLGAEAPASARRFVRLAESGYYNGLTFHRVVPNFVVQGGSPGANEYIGDAAFMRDEIGPWPHVRGAVGISTRGRDTGDAQIFIDLVDTPRLDHEYTVFAHVLNGMEVVDQILEGDVIETVEIL
jgi:peptidyl-prolyl cis-trans isomerase B (cyclophilin B)